MYPTLVSFGSVQISSFSVFFLVGLSIGIYLTWRQAKILLLNQNDIFDALFISLVSAFVGARLTFILLHARNFGFHLPTWMAFWVAPGFYLFGGILAGMFALWIVCKKKKDLSFWVTLDLFSYSFWIAILIGLVGSFLAGSEQGKNSMIYNIEHPVGLYRLVGLFIFLLPYFVYRTEKDRQHSIHSRPGLFSLLFITSFSIVWFMSDFFRSDAIYYIFFTQEQWIMMLALSISIILIFIYHRYWLSYILKKITKKLRITKYS